MKRKLITWLVLLFCSIALLTFSIPGFTLTLEEGHDLQGEGVGLFTVEYPADINEFKEKIKEVEENFNIKLKFEDYENVTGLLDSFFQEPIQPELSIFQINSQFLEHLVRDQIVLPLDNILGDDYFEELPEVLQPIEEVVTYRGQIYGIPSISERLTAGLPYHFGQVVFWNTEVFEEKNLPTPRELKKEDEWTWENMTEIAKDAIQRDGNGKSFKRWGMGGAIHNPNFILNILITYKANIIQEDRVGNYSFALNEPKAIEALEYLPEWHKTPGFLHPVQPEINNLRERQAFNNGEMAMLVRPLLVLPELDEEVTDFIYFPRGPKRDDYFLPTANVTVAAFPVTAKNVDLLIDIHNSIFSMTKKEVGNIVEQNARQFTTSDNSYELYKEMAINWKPLSSYLNIYQEDIEKIEKFTEAMQLINQNIFKIANREIEPEEIDMIKTEVDTLLKEAF